MRLTVYGKVWPLLNKKLACILYQGCVTMLIMLLHFVCSKHFSKISSETAKPNTSVSLPHTTRWHALLQTLSNLSVQSSLEWYWNGTTDAVNFSLLAELKANSILVLWPYFVRDILLYNSVVVFTFKVSVLLTCYKCVLVIIAGHLYWILFKSFKKVPSMKAAFRCLEMSEYV